MYLPVYLKFQWVLRKVQVFPRPMSRVAALEKEGVVLTDPISGEELETEVEAVDGLNIHLAQVMSRYQKEEQKCFVCGSPSHFARDCPH